MTKAAATKGPWEAEQEAVVAAALAAEEVSCKRAGHPSHRYTFVLDGCRLRKVSQPAQPAALMG